MTRSRWALVTMVAFSVPVALLAQWYGLDADLPAEADAFLHDSHVEEEQKKILINLTDLLPSPDESWDEPPADWYECMGRAYSIINYRMVFYTNNTLVLTDEAATYSKSTRHIANMHWFIAVCDRMFPEGAAP